jgi:hypothetical protein
MKPHVNSGTCRLCVVGESMALAYIALIAGLAVSTGVSTLLFPELGALAHDVFTRPRGTWARAPVWLVATPTLAALLGILIARHLPFGLVAVLLSVGSTVAILQVLKSPVAPAISAGLLPLVLGVTSWWYTPSILFGTSLLVLLLMARRNWLPHTLPVLEKNRAEAVDDAADDAVEAAASGMAWMPYFFGFVICATVLAWFTGWHVLLFPPLVVMGYEMFAHPAVCPWAGRPWALLTACTLGAIGGVVFVGWLGVGVLAAVAALGLSILTLRVLDLHVPPALAVSLLPFILHHPGTEFPVAVAAGILILIIFFALSRRRLTARGVTTQPQGERLAPIDTPNKE